REKRAFKDFSEVNLENKMAWTDAIFAYALYYPVVEFLSSLAIALVIWFGGRAVLHTEFVSAHGRWLNAHSFLLSSSGNAVQFTLFGTVTLGILIAFIQYAQRFFRPIQDLSDKYNILQAAMAAAERIFKLLDTPPDIAAPTHPRPGDGSGRIEFQNVWFTYQTLSDNDATVLASSTDPERD